jgi:hypothetical protein
MFLARKDLIENVTRSSFGVYSSGFIMIIEWH